MMMQWRLCLFISIPVATFICLCFLYVREIGRRAAIVSTLREVTEEIWQYHKLTGHLPMSNPPAEDWKMVMLRTNHPDSDVTKSIDRYSGIHGVFNTAGQWLADENSSSTLDPVLVVLVTPDTNGEFGGDWVASENGIMLQMPNAMHRILDVSGRFYVCRRSSRIEELSEQNVRLQTFWEGAATQ